ncbi:hypothetical protein KY333_01690 [Candidatus Woesearchaeota archaeon]|nr:hypothetical protein [Candidatus Woesearchaeota archaeon]MBW2994504.1 hypothetical protein [Candidatus Woesearchaeota archaeon]
MKKRLLFTLAIVILLASFVCASDLPTIPRDNTVGDELPRIPRKTNFLGDNVHILLIEDLAAQMGVQVEELDSKLIEMQQKIEELENMKSNMQGGTKTTGLAIQLSEINSELGNLRQSVNDINQAKTQVEVKKQSNLGGYILVLLGLNGVLLIFVSGMVLKKSMRKEQAKTLHEYIADSLEYGEKKEVIKKDLMSEGWSSEQINKAMKEL